MSRTSGGFSQALWPGLWLAGVLAVLAFSLSFLALRAVGVASGVDASIAWMFPVIIDGFIVLATWATWRFRAQGVRAAWYPAAALVVFSAVSLTGNALHAHPVQVGELVLARWAAAAFSAVPPLALLAASHMLVMIATHRTRAPRAAVLQGAQLVAERPVREAATGRPVASSTTLESEAVVDPLPVAARTPAGQALAGPPAAAPSPAVVDTEVTRPGLRAVPDPVEAGDAVLTAWVRRRTAANQPCTGAQAVIDGVCASESTARRRLRNLRESDPALFQATERAAVRS